MVVPDFEADVLALVRQNTWEGYSGVPDRRLSGYRLGLVVNSTVPGSHVETPGKQHFLDGSQTLGPHDVDLYLVSLPLLLGEVGIYLGVGQSVERGVIIGAGHLHIYLDVALHSLDLRRVQG